MFGFDSLRGSSFLSREGKTLSVYLIGEKLSRQYVYEFVWSLTVIDAEHSTLRGGRR